MKKIRIGIVFVVIGIIGIVFYIVISNWSILTISLVFVFIGLLLTTKRNKQKSNTYTSSVQSKPNEIINQKHEETIEMDSNDFNEDNINASLDATTKFILNQLSEYGCAVKYDKNSISLAYNAKNFNQYIYAFIDGVYMYEETIMDSYQLTKKINCSDINLSIKLLCPFALQDIVLEKKYVEKTKEYWRIMSFLFGDATRAENILKKENGNLSDNFIYRNFYEFIGITIDDICVDEIYVMNDGIFDFALALCMNQNMRYFYFAETKSNKGFCMERKIYQISEDEYEKYRNKEFQRNSLSHFLLTLPQGDLRWQKVKPLLYWLYDNSREKID